MKAAIGVHLVVNAVCIGFQFQDAALLSIVLPAMVLQLSPHSHVETFASVATVSTGVATLAPTLAGWLSDRGRDARFSRARQTAAIVVVDVVALAFIALAPNLTLLIVAVAFAALAVASGETVNQATLPEVVPQHNWGVSTGFRGAFTLAGTTLGLTIAGVLPVRLAVAVNALVLVLSGLTLLHIPPDRQRLVSRHHDRFPLRERPDLLITMLMRAFMLLGLGLFTTYALYFFTDVLHAANAPLRTGLTAVAALLGAIVSSVGSGIISDHVDRRHIVAAAGGAMALAGLGFALHPDPAAIYVYSLVFGVGLGAVYSAGLALTLGTVSDDADLGRDLGVWSTVSGIPAIVAPFFGAAILAHFSDGAGGYRVLFIVASICFALGGASALCVHRQPEAQD